MPARTNADRGREAGAAFTASPHARQGNDEITNLYDFVCDLLHYADTLPTSDFQEGNGRYIARMSLWHYDEECVEEAAERVS